MRRLIAKLKYLKEAYYWYEEALMLAEGYKNERDDLASMLQDAEDRIDFWRAWNGLDEEQKNELPF